MRCQNKSIYYYFFIQTTKFNEHLNIIEMEPLGNHVVQISGHVAFRLWMFEKQNLRPTFTGNIVNRSHKKNLN